MSRYCLSSDFEDSRAERSVRCSYCAQVMCQNVIRDPLISKDTATALKNGFLKTDEEVCVDFSASASMDAD